MVEGRKVQGRNISAQRVGGNVRRSGLGMGAAWEHGGTWAWPVQIVENEREMCAVGQASSRTWVCGGGAWTRS